MHHRIHGTHAGSLELELRYASTAPPLLDVPSSAQHRRQDMHRPSNRRWAQRKRTADRSS